jgi:hypothetical protein
MSLAARFTGKLLKSLEITNFRSLRAYFNSLVGSQLYSLSVNSFLEKEYEIWCVPFETQIVEAEGVSKNEQRH